MKSNRVIWVENNSAHPSNEFFAPHDFWGTVLFHKSRELKSVNSKVLFTLLRIQLYIEFLKVKFNRFPIKDERGDVPGWVLVVLMTTGLVTAIWTIAAPRLSTILRNSLDSMNNVR